MSNHYTVTCPFCDTETGMGKSEFPRTNVGCGHCGARFSAGNWSHEVEYITKPPRTTYSVSVRAETEYEYDEVANAEDAIEKFLDAVAANPYDVLDPGRPREAVSPDRVREVLEDGIWGDGVPVSMDDVSREDLEAHGVDTSRLEGIL